MIAATNKDLPAEIRAQRFREDLFFRLNVVKIVSPPLRDRREDIPALVNHFAGLFAGDNNRRKRAFTAAAMAVIQGRPWRGNVRELRNFVERVLIMTESDPIAEEDVLTVEQETPVLEPLPPGVAGAALAGVGEARPGAAGPDPARFTTLHEYREEAEKVFLLRKLREFRWNVSRMAKAIDTPRSNLYKKLEQYGITRDQVQE